MEDHKVASDAPDRRLTKTIRILSAGAKGGPGKTFLVKNLAGAAVSEGYNVGIVDFDAQRSIGRWLQRRSQKSVDRPGITGYEGDPSEAGDAKDALGIGAHQELADEQAGHDGFARTRVIRQYITKGLAWQH